MLPIQAINAHYSHIISSPMDHYGYSIHSCSTYKPYLTIQTDNRRGPILGSRRIECIDLLASITCNTQLM